MTSRYQNLPDYLGGNITALPVVLFTWEYNDFSTHVVMQEKLHFPAYTEIIFSQHRQSLSQSAHYLTMLCLRCSKASLKQLNKRLYAVICI
jgi:hypothetical protein